MQKWAVILVSCALAFACVRAERAQEEPRAAQITFITPVVQPVVKSADFAVPGELGTNYSISEDFRVWAKYSAAALTGPESSTNAIEYFGGSDGVKSFHSGSHLAGLDYWKLYPAQYWPKAGYLTFHALSPLSIDKYCSSFSHTWGSGFSITGFTVPADPADQFDLLYSDYVFNKQRSDYGEGDIYDEEPDDADYVYNGVNMPFHHALSSVHFALKTDVDYELGGARIRVFLKRLRLLNAYATGDFSEGKATGVTTNAGTPAWSNQSNERSAYLLYEKGKVFVAGSSWNEDMPMVTDGNGWHVALGYALPKGTPLLFRKDNKWGITFGMPSGTYTTGVDGVPYSDYTYGNTITLSQESEYPLKVKEYATLNIWFNPQTGEAKVFNSASDGNDYSGFTIMSPWGVNSRDGIPMIGNGTWVVARNMDLIKDDHFMFLRNDNRNDSFGMPTPDAGYTVGAEFDVANTTVGITVLEAGVYDVYLDPARGKAKLCLSSPNTDWSGYTLTSDWAIHYTGDIPMTKNDQGWHILRGITFRKGVEMVFRKKNGWDEVLGHIRSSSAPYESGKEFDVVLATEGGTDITVLAAGTYDILLNPLDKRARIIDAKDDEYYAGTNFTAFDSQGDWGIHYTRGFKLGTTARDLTEVDAKGNSYAGGNSLLVIPQPLDHSAATGNKVQAELTFAIKYGDVEVEKKVVKDLDVLTAEWQPGKKYTYTITIGLEKVFFDPSVTDWTSTDMP